MKKLSTGDDSTFGNWKKLVDAFFGPTHPASSFLRDKIAEFGEGEEVIMDESQLLLALATMQKPEDAPQIGPDQATQE